MKKTVFLALACLAIPLLAQNPPQKSTPDFLGIHIGGPTRVGHYFLPHLITSAGHLHKPVATETKPAGPVMKQKKTYDWSFVYDPQGNGGNGTLQATLGDESVTHNLEPGVKSEGATFDRFGLLVVPEGGHHVKIYLDDLKYTAAAGAQ